MNDYMETFWRPAPSDAQSLLAMPLDEEALYCLDLYLATEREHGNCPATVQVFARFSGANRDLVNDWCRRLSLEAIKRATALFLKQWDAVILKHEVLGSVMPRCKSIEIFPWVACAVCGKHPENCNPLPDGWQWDSDEINDSWVWCPEHR
jgi:hypothetical protein